MGIILRYKAGYKGQHRPIQSFGSYKIWGRLLLARIIKRSRKASVVGDLEGALYVWKYLHVGHCPHNLHVVFQTLNRKISDSLVDVGENAYRQTRESLTRKPGPQT